jgi:hypothetical protein
MEVAAETMERAVDALMSVVVDGRQDFLKKR